ncbi:FAD-dependent oxidoreductase [Sphingomonas xinjiangensis]|uniref:FAD dependent oxidoreductase n=1 Tax=Sphingomonas xinjiangensis TaxID=643568 RepID=A0A840YRH1_9SPHN|nr:FAD-dependent oxidoreductase [Sphingomonas xinjiangensis]MBB5712182.1 hypothetical protein [Sphingomonas xinjiangensis]
MIADLVVYGSTPSGITAAVQAARDGLAVAIVGGWRDNHIGGMMSGGLGFTDFRRLDAFGGLARDITVAAASGGTQKNAYAFKPSSAEAEFERLLRSEGVPFIRTSGVTEVIRQGKAIKEIRTADGRVARGRTFVDASYEGDLMARAGVGFIVGRDEADGRNPLDGYFGETRTSGGSEHQFGMNKQLLDVDPFVIAGDPSSGYLPTVKAASNKPIGSADNAVQAYNFRMAMTDQPSKRLDLPSTPPAGYDPVNYELLLRMIAAIEAAGMRHGRDWDFPTDIMGAHAVADGVYDVNANGGFSTDPFGLSWNYPNASYAERETIWKAHQDFIKGFFYTLGWSKDPRLPASLQAEVRQWGLVKTEFQRPHKNDEAGWPYQLYVREARRMNNGLLWSGADLEQRDRTPIRSGSPVAMASYWQDSHHVQRIAIAKPGGGWKVWNEGNLFATAGGADKMSQLPYEIMLPRAEECSNLLVTFCVAASHQAFSSIRMELTSMVLGQAAGAAAALACAGSDKASFHSVDRGSLQSRLTELNVVFDEPGLVDRAIEKVEQKFASFKSRVVGG